MGFFHVRNSSHGYRKEGVERTSSNCEIVRTAQMSTRQSVVISEWKKKQLSVSTVPCIVYSCPSPPFRAQTNIDKLSLVRWRSYSLDLQFITKNHGNNCLIIRTTLCYRQLSWPQNYQIPTISSSIVRISLLRSGQMFRSIKRTFDGKSIVAKLQDFNRETSDTRSLGRYALVPFYPPPPLSVPLVELARRLLPCVIGCTRSVKSWRHLWRHSKYKNSDETISKREHPFFPGNMIKSWKNERPHEREIYDRQRPSSSTK